MSDTKALGLALGLGLIALLLVACGGDDDGPGEDAAMDTSPLEDTGAGCPPCAAPPDEACVGVGVCGCGPYTCPIACGDQTCGPTEYCRFTPGGGILDDSYVCDRLPVSCAGQRSCECLAGEPCGFDCADDGEGNPRLTCPGPG